MILFHARKLGSALGCFAKNSFSLEEEIMCIIIRWVESVAEVEGIHVCQFWLSSK